MANTRKKTTRKPRAKKAAAENRRGSPEAIEKRRVARAFNDLLGGNVSAKKIDGRTEKRRARLLKDLSSESKKELKPIDVLSHVKELLELGETLSSIRKVRTVPRPRPADDDAVALVKRLHAAYAFPLVAYRFVGIGEDSLTKAGVKEGGAAPPAKRRGRKKKAA
ncbi:MAG: hypothetical protein IPJ34_38565 [Myxococcales bacterium]|nr:hypothetical protein [Myxococcales bacterium]